MTGEPHLRYRRIVVALDSGPESLEILEAAAWVAKGVQGKLAARFIEEQDLVNLAAISFSKEVPFGPAAARNLDPNRLRRDLESRAAKARQMLEREARRRQVEWSFEVVRNRSEAAMTAQLEPGDLIALTRELGPAARRGQMGRQLFSATRSTPGAMLIVCQRAKTRPGPVTVPFDGSEASLRALGVAEEVAGAEGAALRVLLWVHEADAAIALQNKAREAVAKKTSLRFRHITGCDRAALPRYLSQIDRGLIVLPAEGGLLNEAQTDELMQGACSPLLII